LNRRQRSLYYSQAILFLALVLAACGREAPPRASTAAPISARQLPTAAAAPILDAAPAAAEQRALGDPDAPITVIEYGDYQ
jgi:hypothetical protein